MDIEEIGRHIVSSAAKIHRALGPGLFVVNNVEEALRTLRLCGSRIFLPLRREEREEGRCAIKLMS